MSETEPCPNKPASNHVPTLVSSVCCRYLDGGLGTALLPLRAVPGVDDGRRGVHVFHNENDVLKAHCNGELFANNSELLIKNEVLELLERKNTSNEGKKSSGYRKLVGLEYHRPSSFQTRQAPVIFGMFLFLNPNPTFHFMPFELSGLGVKHAFRCLTQHLEVK